MCPKRLIFVDIDGVLNDLQFDKQHDQMIDVKKVKILAKIVESTKSRIILSSTWRYLKDCDEQKEPQAAKIWKYLNNILTEHGLKISDTTPVIDGNRPKEIVEYLKTHKNVSWISIEDDFSVADYEKYNISEHLIQTYYFVSDSSEGGLKEEHIKIAKHLFEFQEQKYRKG